MKFVKWAFNKGLDIKDWRIAMIYFAFLSFLVYCVFFGNLSALIEYFIPKAKIQTEQIAEPDNEELN